MVIQSKKVWLADQFVPAAIEVNDGRITAIAVRDAQETDGVGGVLTADGSDYINALIAGQDDLDGVDGVSGATMTSNALKQAVRYAQEAIVR